MAIAGKAYKIRLCRDWDLPKVFGSAIDILIVIAHWLAKSNPGGFSMDQQLKFIKMIRTELNGNYLYFTDTCNKIFDLLINTYTENEELLQIMEDGLALERALVGTRLEFMLSSSTPLQWAYVASVFRELAHTTRVRTGSA